MINEKILNTVPNARQIALQEMGFYLFIHFGMNTFSGKEWGSGKESPSLFCPESIDTDQWARIALDVGAGAIIFTAKHHEGFCLWQTNTTEHSIKNSPYQNGKGDVVKQLAESCARYGIKLGLYLSPADRNSAYFGTDKYNDFYCEQLTELLSNYGEIFCLWLDGADGGTKADGKTQNFDYDRYFETARNLQPNIILANCGPEVRWVGNEEGKTRDAEWCVVPACVCPSVAKNYKGTVPAPRQTDNDLGSIELLSKYDEYLWYPAEVDMSLHKGWFYHPFQMPHGISRLYSAYMRSVGGNCTFLLNVPPNKKGRIAKRDELRLKSLKKEIKRTFANKLAATFTTVNNCEYQIDLPTVKAARTIVIREDVTKSQRVEKFSLTFFKRGAAVYGQEGTTIGFSKFVCLAGTIDCDRVILRIEKFRGDEVYIKDFEIYS